MKTVPAVMAAAKRPVEVIVADVCGVGLTVTDKLATAVLEHPKLFVHTNV